MFTQISPLWLRFVVVFFTCAAATFFYSLMLKAPPRALAVSAAVSGTGYIIYYFLLGQGDVIASFAGTIFVAVAGEILARVMKMPSTVFVIPGIIPLVPGYMLYRTMFMLVQNDFNGFVHTGATTFFIAGVMAVGIAMTNFLSRRISALKKQHISHEGERG